MRLIVYWHLSAFILEEKTSSLSTMAILAARFHLPTPIGVIAEIAPTMVVFLKAPTSRSTLSLFSRLR